jgi:phosphoglycolate phosphatase-like HAD superfamily hydrolase
MSDRPIPSGSIFVLGEAGMVELREAAYDSENLLQSLLAEHPRLLAGDQMDVREPRRLLLVQREMGVPGEAEGGTRWSLDHLFLDQDGIPTLIEVKRSTDSRIRREVVGQMLDYAANAVAFWPVEGIRASFEATCSSRGVDSDVVLQDFLKDEQALDDFWQGVRTNLQAGRVRLVFVADVIPVELRRIVEFLNQQMSPAEVLAVEVKLYAGEGLKTLVPRVLGATAAAQQRRGSGGSIRQWDDISFFAELARRCPLEEVATARRLLDWARDRGLRIWWGRGRNSGSLFPMLDVHGHNYFTFSVWTTGQVQVQFQRMRDRPATPNPGQAEVLRQKLNQLSGVEFDAGSTAGRPRIPLSTLAENGTTRSFLAAFDDYVRAVRDHPLEEEE